MNIYTFKLTKKTIAIAVGALALIALLLVVLFSCGNNDADEASAKLTDKEDFVAYIESLGYTVSENGWQERQVVIPAEFDEVYTQYNEMQKQNGFDLEKFKGKKVDLHTFSITNYEGASDVLCDLLVYKGKIIGGAVYTADVSGFMHGLCKKP